MDISDAVATLVHLFVRPVELPCESDAANLILFDVNGDATLNLNDAVFLLNFLFRGGASPVVGESCVRIEGCPNTCVR